MSPAPSSRRVSPSSISFDHWPTAVSAANAPRPAATQPRMAELRGSVGPNTSRPAARTMAAMPHTAGPNDQKPTVRWRVQAPSTNTAPMTASWGPRALDRTSGAAPRTVVASIVEAPMATMMAATRPRNPPTSSRSSRSPTNSNSASAASAVAMTAAMRPTAGRWRRTGAPTSIVAEAYVTPPTIRPRAIMTSANGWTSQAPMTVPKRAPMTTAPATASTVRSERASVAAGGVGVSVASMSKGSPVGFG